MGGAHAGRSAGWLRSGAAIATEFAVLALVAALTYVATRFVHVYWAVIDCGTDPAMRWLLAGCALVPTVLRRYLPTVALLLAAALFGWYPAAAAAFALTAYSAVLRIRSRRRLAMVASLAAVIPLGVALIGSGFQWESVFTAFGFGVVVCVLVPVMLGLLLGQRERLVGALRQQTGYLRKNYELADSAARLQERSRIAEEMHDVLGHRLSLISLYAGALELDATRSDRPGDEAKLIRGTVVSAMDELRRILGVLREPGHETSTVSPAATVGAKADIADLVAQSQAAGIQVALTWLGDDLHDAAPGTRRAVHRIVREALTNVHRHAAGAGARVVVRRGDELVRVEVSNGVGGAGRTNAQPSGSGSGLVGVQERVRLLGGSFWARPAPGGGFHLMADLPTDPSASTRPVDAGSARKPVPGDVESGPVAADAPAARARADRWSRAGMSAVLSTGLAGTIAIVNVAFGYVGFEPASRQRNPATLVQIGMSRAEVLDTIGEGDPFLGFAARGAEPARVPDAECVYQTYGPKGGPEPATPSRAATAPVWDVRRYCFHLDLLVQIDQFDLPEPGRER